MRRLHAAAAASADARLAIQMFCYSVRKQIAAMAAALGGLDMLIFTGGIGENDPEVRATICGGLSWMGVSLEAACAPEKPNTIHKAVVRVLPSQEDEEIARHTWALVAQPAL